mmetsp:Transcript_59089/g.122221  ORF Transcript_59089/g.122221 Transcript_59089/m.122221 type:complete len:200 (+) Transcript_59089:392-991(+)
MRAFHPSGLEASGCARASRSAVSNELPQPFCRLQQAAATKGGRPIVFGDHRSRDLDLVKVEKATALATSDAADLPMPRLPAASAAKLTAILLCSRCASIQAASSAASCIPFGPRPAENWAPLQSSRQRQAASKPRSFTMRPRTSTRHQASEASEASREGPSVSRRHSSQSASVAAWRKYRRRANTTRTPIPARLTGMMA